MSEIVDPRDAPEWAEEVERKCRNMPQNVCHLCIDSHAERDLARYCACPLLAHATCLGDHFLDAQNPKCERCYTPIAIDWTFREAEKPCPHASWELFKRQRRATHLWRRQLEYHLGPESTTALYMAMAIVSALVMALYASGCTSLSDKFGVVGCLVIGLVIFSAGAIFCSRQSFNVYYDVVWFGVVLLVFYLPACDADWRDNRGSFFASWLWMELLARANESLVHLLVCLSAPLEIVAKIAVYQSPVPVYGPPEAASAPAA